jgi:hypothetical protein
MGSKIILLDRLLKDVARDAAYELIDTHRGLLRKSMPATEGAEEPDQSNTS